MIGETSPQDYEIFCEGLKPRPGLLKNGVEALELSFSSDNPNLNNIVLDLRNYATYFVQQDRVAFDLIRIAVYVYIADCQIKRVKDYDVLGNEFNGKLNFHIPVLEVELWKRSDIKGLLEDILIFATGHKYSFDFVEWKDPDSKIFLDVFAKDGLKVKQEQIDCVSLFSGGIDSLVAALQLIDNKRTPLLVSHFTTNKLKAYRDKLQVSIGQIFGTAPLKWEIRIHNKRNRAVENTQRSRSFLYACLGISIAKCMELKEVFFCDNGIVSLNLRATNLNIGTFNTRSTNPKLLSEINKLANQIWSNSPQLQNLLLDKTKAGVIQELVDKKREALLKHTTSCVHTIDIKDSEDVRFCGTCSQCIDRRIAIEFLNISQQDENRKSYCKDIFNDSLEDSLRALVGKTHLENLFRRAKQLINQPHSELLRLMPELWDFIPDDIEEEEFLAGCLNLYKKYGNEYISVVHEKSKPVYTGSKISKDSFVYWASKDNFESSPKVMKSKRIRLNIPKMTIFIDHVEIQELTTHEFHCISKICLEPDTIHNTDNFQKGEELATITAYRHISTIKRKIHKSFKSKEKSLSKDFNIFKNIRGAGYKLDDSLEDEIDVCENNP